MNLTSLLALYNSTYNAIYFSDVLFSSDPDLKRLYKEVADVVLDGCPYDCCSMHHCGKMSKEFRECEDYVLKTYQKIDHVIDCTRVNITSTIPEIYDIESFPFYDDDVFDLIYFLYSDPEDDCGWVNKLNGHYGGSLERLNFLIGASKRTREFIFDNAISKHKKESELFLSSAILQACFSPKKIPKQFDQVEIKKFERIFYDVLKKRLLFLERDILKEMEKFNFISEIQSSSGSGTDVLALNNT